QAPYKPQLKPRGGCAIRRSIFFLFRRTTSMDRKAWARFISTAEPALAHWLQAEVRKMDAVAGLKTSRRLLALEKQPSWHSNISPKENVTFDPCAIASKNRCSKRSAARQ